MSIENLFNGLMEFDEVLRNDRTTIPIVYFMVHSNRTPLVARK